MSISIDFKTSDTASRNRALVQFIVKHLPNVWVLNDDYIVSRNKVAASQGIAPSGEGESKQSVDVWRTKPNTVKEQNLLCAIQDLPTYDAIADAFKLDILLEDYLQEASVLNTFTDQLALSNTSAIKTSFMQNLNPLLNGKSMPSIELYQLLLIPHGLRLDLSVILTASILYHIPTAVLNDTLVILLSKYMSVSDLQSLGQLPLFARTAIVSIIRRICRRELDELAANGCLFPMPTRQHINMSTTDHNEFAQSRLNYKGVEGFYFLRPIKWYLLRPIDIESAGLSRQQQQQFQQQNQSNMHFTEVEMEILRKLPDTPTLSSCTQEFDESSESHSNKKHGNIFSSESSIGSLSSGSNVPHYKKWTSYVARHTVLLLTKSPTCPPLTRQQTSKANQDIYCEMLPFLAAAQMTLEDLDVELSGPSTDGRMLRAQLSKSLQFGVGIPRAGPSSLAWNAMDPERFRNYDKPWRPIPPQEMDDTFLTTSKPKSPQRNIGNATRQVMRESASSRPLSPSFVLSSESNSRRGSAVPDIRESPQRQLQHHLHQQAQLQMQLAHRLRQHDIERALSISILPNSRPPSAAPRTAQTPTSSNHHSPINSPGDLRSRPFSSTIRDPMSYFDDVTTTTMNNVVLSTDIAATGEGTVGEKSQDLLSSAQFASAVKGYSADARHEPTFLLASPTNIQRQNSAFQLCGSVLKWDSIEHAPVVLPVVPVSVIPVEAAVGLSEKLTERSDGNTQDFGFIDSVALNPFDVSTLKQDSSAGGAGSYHSSHSAKYDEFNVYSRHSRIVEVFDDDLSDAASGKSLTGKNDKSAVTDLRMDVINNKTSHDVIQKQLVGVLSAAASTDDGSHTIDIDDQSSETGSVMSQTRQQLHVLLGGQQKVSNLGASWNQKHLTEAKDLLIEMGTVKNLRQLERLNVSDKMSRMKRSSKAEAKSKEAVKEAAATIIPKSTSPSSPKKPMDPIVKKPDAYTNESSFFLTLLSSSAHAVKKKNKASRRRSIIEPAASARKSNLNSARTGSNDSNDEMDDDFLDDADDDEFDEDDDEEDLDDDLDSEVDDADRVGRRRHKSKWTDGKVVAPDPRANETINAGVDSTHSLDQGEGAVVAETSPKIKAKDSFLDVLTRNSSRNSNLSPKVKTTESAVSLLQNTTISLVEAVKLTTNYDNVFTSQNGVELGAKSTNGKQISPTWYPCDKKVMYRLSLAATLNLQKPQLQPLQPPHSNSLRQTNPNSVVTSVRPPSDLLQNPGLESSSHGKQEFGTGVAEELSLRHDDYFRSLLRPLRPPRRSLTTVIPLPVAEQTISSHNRQQQLTRKQQQLQQQSHFRRGGGFVDLELSSPLSLLSQSLQPPVLPLTQEASSLARSQTSSSTSQPLHRPTAGPAPPFPSLVSLRRSASMSSDSKSSSSGAHRQQSLTRPPSSPAAGDPFAVEPLDEGMDNLSAILKSSIRGMLHREDSFQQPNQQHLQQQTSEVSSAGSDRHISPKHTVFTDSYESAAQHSHTESSGEGVVDQFIEAKEAALSLTHPLWSSGQWAPLNSPGSASVDSQPFRGLVAGSSSQKLQRVSSNVGQMQSYRKHKAATHKLQLNRGFKYSRNNTNFKIEHPNLT